MLSLEYNLKKQANKNKNKNFQRYFKEFQWTGHTPAYELRTPREQTRAFCRHQSSLQIPEQSQSWEPEASSEVLSLGSHQGHMEACKSRPSSTGLPSQWSLVAQAHCPNYSGGQHKALKVKAILDSTGKFSVTLSRNKVKLLPLV